MFSIFNVTKTSQIVDISIHTEAHNMSRTHSSNTFKEVFTIIGNKKLGNSVFF